MFAQTLRNPLQQSPLRSPFQAQVGGGWTPLALGANLLAWYDISDTSTLFQDTGATTLVTTAGQSVRYLADKSGNGKHVTFSGTTPPTCGVVNGARCLLPTVHESRGLCASLLLSQPYSSVVMADVNAEQQVLYDEISNTATGGAAGALLLIDTVSSPLRVTAGDSSVGVSSASSQAPKAIVATFNGASSTVRIDGTLRASGSIGGGSFDGLSLFNIRGTPNPIVTTYHATSPFFGMFLVSGGLTGAALSSAEAYAGTVLRPALNRLIVIGDSTTAAYGGQNAVASYLAGTATVVDIAVSGHTIAQQQTAFLASAPRRWSRSVVLMIGLNDLDPAEAASVAITRLQTLVTNIRNQTSGYAKVAIATMTPCRQRLLDVYGGTNGPIAYAKWQAMNEAMSGGGGTPITGVDARITSHTAALDDGTGRLAAIYDTGDGIHENNAARQIIAAAWASALTSLGVY